MLSDTPSWLPLKSIYLSMSHEAACHSPTETGNSFVRGTVFKDRPKKNGKGVRRTGDAVFPGLKTVLKRINSLLQPILENQVVYGTRGGKTVDDAAKAHAKSPGFLQLDLDIKDFFPSIGHRCVYAAFVRIGCSPDVASILTRLTTHEGVLPQGFPSSPAIASLVLCPLDNYLARMQEDLSICCTRYADDISVTGSESDVRCVQEGAIKVLSALGLRVNSSKVRRTRDDHGREVLGLRVHSGKVKLPMHYRRELRGEIRRGLRYGFVGSERRSVEGKLRRLGRYQPEQAKKLWELLLSSSA